MLIGWFTVSGGNMTKVKVENKSRKQTVKVKKTSSATQPTSQVKQQANQKSTSTDHKSLLSRIDDLEKQVSKLNSLTIKFARNSVVDRFERSKLEQEIDDNRRIYLKFAWGLWIVFVIFVIVFGIVLN